MTERSRRAFLGLGAVVGPAACSREHAPAQPPAPKAAEPKSAAPAETTSAPPPPVGPAPPLPGPVPKRPFGSTGLEVSGLGLGGFHLGQASTLDEATRIVAEALAAGVNFFDNAWEY